MCREDRANGNHKQVQTVHTATNNRLFSLSLQQKIQKKFECLLRREGLGERNTEKEQVRENAGKTLNYMCKKRYESVMSNCASRMGKWELTGWRTYL